MKTRVKAKNEFKSSLFQVDRSSITFIISGEPGICCPAILISIVYIPGDVGLYKILYVPFLLSLISKWAADLSGPLMWTFSGPITDPTLRESTVNSFIVSASPSFEAFP